MFNFHKPRTYRSAEGCCVCRAKTSSSRFIDSRKYESDVMQCFDLKQPRQGDICNACVLLTKRYKRLPQGSKKNWSHMVDARVGVPGNNKSHVKYKSERINSKVNNNNNINNNNNNINNSNNNNNSSSNSSENISNNHSSTVGNNNSSTSVNFMPEKFTKIYKKSKRTKDTSSTIMAAGTGPPGSKRRSNSHGWSQNLSSNSLPPTPDSMDSDYEDSRLYGALANTVVQFQTQTRASAHRAAAVANARRYKAAIKVVGGSKRRKCLPPRKYRKTSACDENVRFFEAAEWQERKTCCGTFYECTDLGGSLLLDVAQYNPCENHKQPRPSDTFDDKKVIKITTPSSSLTKTPTVASNDTVNGCGINTFKATPALKKHHLFYKRQSECFPHADIIAANDNQSQSASVQHKTTNLHCNGAATKMHSVASTPSTTTSPNKSLNKTDFDKNSSLMYQKCTARNSSNVQDTVTMSNAIQPNSGNYVNMLKHSSARTTTLTAPTTISSTCVGGNTRAALSKTPSTFLHKLKGDSGRIVKQTLDKFNNTATIAQLKTNDFMDMKQMIKTVDKSHILHKSLSPALATPAAPAPTNISAAAYNVTTSYQTPSQPLTKASLSAASPTSSTSSTSSSSTKFSDNSSDSGFDENLLDRKSASPLQEDNEKKFSSRSTAGTGGGGGGGVQTMFLTSGVQIQSQPTTNIMIGGGGHEIASKLLQNRKQQQKQVYSALLPMTTITPNNHSVTPNSAITSSVKITQISASSATGNLAVPAVGVAAQAKMRAIYNNNNTIQHENGITTILPASSLAATNQTAAMNYMQPSTVTITPAPPPGAPQPINPNMGQKLTAANAANTATTTSTGTANVIHLPTANNKLITTTLTGGGHQAAYLHATNNNIINNIKNNLPHNYQYHHQQQQHHHVYNNNYAQSNLQQKVVLLKTSSTASNSQKYHRHGSSVAAKVGSGASNDNRSGSAIIR